MNKQKFIDCKPLKDFLLLDIANCDGRNYDDFMKVIVKKSDCLILSESTIYFHAFFRH